MLPLKIRDKEKLSFLNLTFPYFLGKENKKMCEEIAPLIKTLSAKDKNAELICSEVDLLMDIYIHPNRERIAELRALADENEGEVKAMYLERLAILYTMLDEMDNAKALLMKRCHWLKMRLIRRSWNYLLKRSAKRNIRNSYYNQKQAALNLLL